jgi:hypothetical protein
MLFDPSSVMPEPLAVGACCEPNMTHLCHSDNFGVFHGVGGNLDALLFQLNYI